MHTYLATFFVLSALSVSCVTVESSFDQRGLNQAAGDLDCAKDKIQYTVLNRNDGLGCNLSQVEVTGCGKKAIYNCDAQQQWVRSTPVKTVATAKTKKAPKTASK